MVGLAAGAVALCCVLPAVLTAGFTVTILGLGLRSWVLVGAGSMAVVAWLVWLRAKRKTTGAHDARRGDA